MCGFTGSLALAPGTEPSRAWVDAATVRLAHRGPDGTGSYCDTHIALGFCRLAVLDPTPAGHQPMASHDGRFHIVFNGEIYNHLDLGDELRLRHGVRLDSRTDTEVLLELYRYLGKDVVKWLRGMYAFAIWDTLDKELFAARDPFGIKPFFYCTGQEADLRFASEKKALVPEDVGHPIDADALRRYLAFQYVPGPATLTPGVRQLPPGHTLTARPGTTPQVQITQFCQLHLRPAPRRRRGTPGRVLATLRESVGAHMRSDVPVGAFLSGGVDSATICALARERNPGLHTFTVGFERAGFSEIDEARDTAGALGVPIHPYVITPEELVSHLPRIVWHLDDPLGDPAAIALWFLAREARKRVTVVLSGEGADELFGGYGIYRQPWPVRATETWPGWLLAGLRRAARMFPSGLRGPGLLRRMGTPLADRYIGNAHVVPDRLLGRLARAGTALPYDITAPMHRRAATGRLDDISTMQLVDLHTWLPYDILVKADRMTMSHGLELRVPFLDPKVFTLAADLHRHEKLGPKGQGKRALRQAVSSILPPAAAQRPKLGFPVPIGSWLAGELAGWAEHVLQSAAIDEHLDRRAVLHLLHQHQQGRADHGRKLWVMLMFSLWHQVFVERLYDFVVPHQHMA